jgi:hypothetical protein
MKQSKFLSEFPHISQKWIYNKIRQIDLALKEEIISPSEYSTIMQDYQSYSIF